MRLLEFYKKIMLTKRIVFYSLVMIIFIGGGYFVSNGTLDMGYLMLGYLIFIIFYFRLERRIFFGRFRERELGYIKEFESVLLQDKIEEYSEYIEFLYSRVRGERKLSMANLHYLYHSLITIEPYQHFNDVVQFNKLQMDKNIFESNFLYELERLKFVRLGEYDKVVSILKSFIAHFEKTFEGKTEAEVEQRRNTLKVIHYTIDALEQQDKELFEKVINYSQTNHLFFKTIGTYINIKICKDYGWDDLIPQIKSKSLDIKGDIYLVDYILTA